MYRLILIGAGGFIGSVLRYLVSGYVQELSNSVDFPYGTLAVNLIGCLLIGFLTQLAEMYGAFNVETRAFLIIGLLGGFTTFSTFSNDTVNLLRLGESSLAFLNIAAHILAALFLVWAGRTLAYLIWR
ncbi:MAG: fluoride efflux transporter CrcB [Chloroflexi bacterium]|jgi:CrcB protein|nr:fluoride efflux transporter CrcB [Chloroflexota bacterium]